MILQATHTHLYPGSRGKVSGLAQITDLATGSNCLVEFADGAAAPARISRAGDDWLLQTETYRTAAGTNIPAKRWLVRLQENGACLEFRILKKSGNG